MYYVIHIIHYIQLMMMMMMMMMALCPKAGSLAFTPPGDEMSEMVSRCLPHRQLSVSNLPEVTTQGRKVDSNPRIFGCKAVKAQNIPLHHGVPINDYQRLIKSYNINTTRIKQSIGHFGVYLFAISIFSSDIFREQSSTCATHWDEIQ